MVCSPTGGSDLFLILGCMTSNFLYLSFSTLYSSSLWRNDTIVWAKFNMHPSQISPPSLQRTIKPPPPSPPNVFEINKSPGGLNRGFKNTKGDANFCVGLLGAWFNILKTQARKRASCWISILDPDSNIEHLISKNNTILASCNCF